MFIRRFKVREHERGLVFRDGQFEDVLGPGVAWLFDPLRKLHVEIVDGALAVARPRRPGRDRALGGAAARGACRRPEGPRAGDRLGRRPPRGGAEAGALRAVDGVPRRQGGDRRRARGALRARAARGDPRAARHGVQLPRPSRSRRATRACSSATAATRRRSARACTRSGRASPGPWSSSSTCASRSPTSPGRRS